MGLLSFQTSKQTRWPKSASELYRPRDRSLSAKFVPTFNGERVPRGQRDGSLGSILDFLDRVHYFLFQIAPQLYSRGWVDPVPDSLLLGKSGSAGMEPGTSGSVASNSDH
jgi:hypothetical protein